MYSDMEIAAILKRAPRFDSIAHAVYWLRWRDGYDLRSWTETLFPGRPPPIEIHLAAIYSLAEELYRQQNMDGV